MSASDGAARAVIARLGLVPHPEGGWYRETWRAPPGEDGRGSASAILFLLAAGQRSHWHRVDAAEIWFWHAGDPIALLTAPAAGGAIAMLALGGEVLAGQAPQGLVAAGDWQAAEARAGWGLVSCVVSPGFRFDGFELAPPGWTPDA